MLERERRFAHSVAILNISYFFALQAVRMAVDYDLLDPSQTRFPALTVIVAVNILNAIAYLIRTQRALRSMIDD